MSKKKRVGEFIFLLGELSEEEIFSLARIMGIRFGGLEVLDPDGNPIGETIGELRDKYSKEELKEKDYKVRAVKKDAEEIAAEIMEVFYKSGWGQQNDVLDIMKATIQKKKDVVEDVVEDSVGAPTINAPMRPAEEVDNGVNSED